MPTDDLVDRFRAALERFERIHPAVEAAAPWPLAERFDTSTEASWGPPEVLAHVAEMLGYWRVELERVAAGVGDPVPFGRVATDTARLDIIERDRSLPPADLFARIAGGSERFLETWARWTPAQRDRIGLHPRLGEIAVGASADRFIVDHLGEHAAQLEETTGTAPTGD
jgi:DinB superfamily